MKLKRVLVVLFCLALMAAMLSQPAFAYNRYSAIANARANYSNYQFNWYTFNADCTNFVSVCSWRNTGMTQDRPAILPSVSLADWTKGYSTNSTTTYWYMEPQTVKKLFINKTVWCYSSSWAVVKDFRNYMGKWAAHYIGCSSTTVTPYNIYNQQQINTLVSNLKCGDVVQKGDDHSIMIVTQGSNAANVQYCGHSNSRRNEPLTTFITSCQNAGVYTVHVIHFD